MIVVFDCNLYLVWTGEHIGMTNVKIDTSTSYTLFLELKPNSPVTQRETPLFDARTKHSKCSRC
jgi:hypothetical protein